MSILAPGAEPVTAEPTILDAVAAARAYAQRASDIADLTSGVATQVATQIAQTTVEAYTQAVLNDLVATKVAEAMVSYRPAITSDEGKLALMSFLGTSGSLGDAWFDVVENDMNNNHASANDAYRVRYDGTFWPVGGFVWSYVQNVLAAHFGWNDDTAIIRMMAIQTYILDNR